MPIIPPTPSSSPTPQDVRERVDAIYRADARRILATLIRVLGDFDTAEEALHDAFRAALERWPETGVPANPLAWLVSAGRFKAIDRLRRDRRFTALDEDAHERYGVPAAASTWDDEPVPDDQLRLIFTCCHPALAPDARIALTLREVCGLTTEEIARAFLTPTPTLAQRIVRAKAKIRDAGIPYQLPEPADVPDRLDAVLHVVYLVFNEGYSPTSGEVVTRDSLSAEAIRLARLLMDLMPTEAEVMGLLALLLLQESRRAARTSADGELVLLEAQDRTQWDAGLIAEGAALVARAMATGDVGALTVQAAIAAVHAEATTAEATDWNRIVALYDLLLAAQPSPVVALNRAVAVAMQRGPAHGLALVDALFANDELTTYHLAHATRGELCLRLGRHADARESFAAALALARQGPERRHLQRRLDQIGVEMRP